MTYAYAAVSLPRNWYIGVKHINLWCGNGFFMKINLPDDVKYNDGYEKNCGFCSNSDKEILTRINELIKEN